ncbi:Chaperone protein dnaJ 11, chloroplastic [Vitis vinifera]|uniref:Chaperone protein dnaJ 11, chloroplastic n=2 Tax=Vitis TaxID=3603 RepID=A0A438IIY3_VITVI|nr:Chaperone protein dnaJ 11, chloroplastic [Vitis vinifera]
MASSTHLHFPILCDFIHPLPISWFFIRFCPPLHSAPVAELIILLIIFVGLFMASSSSLYEVLGIPVSASGNEIKAAYRRLARVCHPDVVAMNQKETSANEFMKIHAAYSTLSDPDKRANYDQDLFRRRRPVMATAMRTGGSSFSGFSRRTWETDQCW